MLAEGCNISIKMSPKCTICKIIKDEPEFNLLKKNKDEEVRLANGDVKTVI